MNKLNKYRKKSPFYDSNITPKNKKYSVITPEGKLIHFGARNYQHFKDQTKQKKWSNKNHLDKERRKRYLARAKGIKDKNGNLTWKNPESANYYAVRYLW